MRTPTEYIAAADESRQPGLKKVRRFVETESGREGDSARNALAALLATARRTIEGDARAR